jgi:UDP-2,3-diacylglucosamine pyrophosphatase LpxH
MNTNTRDSADPADREGKREGKYERKQLLRVRTVIISDVHLGTPDSKAGEVNHFLRHVHCEKLILNGDIIDGWQLTRRGGHWTHGHTRVVRTILKMLGKRRTEIIYLRGNHDDILARFLPLEFGGLRVVEDHVHEGLRGRYLVLHGDVFDSVAGNIAWLSHLGDWGYRALMRINRAYNRWRAWRGLEYWSLSKAIKARVKTAMSHISKFEERVAKLARERGCDGAMCGHIHTPADRMINGMHYLNSGDWVESLTALVEHYDGSYQLIEYADFVKKIPMETKATETKTTETKTMETTASELEISVA